MKLQISRTAALSAAFVAAIARIFIDLALDAGPIHNGIWISALLGAVPIIPYLLCAEAPSISRSAGLPFCLLLLAITAVDAAKVMSIVVRAAGCLTLEHVPDWTLLLPVALAMLWCVWRNGDAIGYAARLWTRLFPLMLLVVILLQARHYHARWLLPLLGNGWREIFVGGIRASGWFVPATAILFTSDEGGDTAEPRRSAVGIASAATLAALLLVLRLMMAPAARSDMPWLARLDALLTNGRAPIYLQLPMILVFFVGSLHLLGCECFAASALLQRAIPALDGHVSGAVVTAGCAALSLSGLAGRAMDRLAPWSFCAAALGLALTVLVRRFSGRGGQTCEG